MEAINKEIQAYFREEIRQCKIMLNGILNSDYGEFIIRKAMYYEYVIALLEKEEQQCRENTF